MPEHAIGWVVGAGASDRPLHIILGFGPGIAPDVALRTFTERLSPKLGQPIIIENVTGAAGNLAAQRVAQSEPDGHTLLFTSSSSLVSAALYKSTPVDMATDFQPISILYEHPNVLVASRKIGIGNVADFIDFVCSHPGKLTVSSAGTGTTQHLATEMLRVWPAWISPTSRTGVE